jgi:hypothetical protein
MVEDCGLIDAGGIGKHARRCRIVAAFGKHSAAKSQQATLRFCAPLPAPVPRCFHLRIIFIQMIIVKPPLEIEKN